MLFFFLQVVTASYAGFRHVGSGSCTVNGEPFTKFGRGFRVNTWTEAHCVQFACGRYSNCVGAEWVEGDAARGTESHCSLLVEPGQTLAHIAPQWEKTEGSARGAPNGIQSGESHIACFLKLTEPPTRAPTSSPVETTAPTEDQRTMENLCAEIENRGVCMRTCLYALTDSSLDAIRPTSLTEQFCMDPASTYHNLCTGTAHCETNAPTAVPTNAPSAVPTNAPTAVPTNAPTTAVPTNAPTTAVPTNAPSAVPTNAPTSSKNQDATTLLGLQSPTTSPQTGHPAKKLTFLWISLGCVGFAACQMGLFAFVLHLRQPSTAAKRVEFDMEGQTRDSGVLQVDLKVTERQDSFRGDII